MGTKGTTKNHGQKDILDRFYTKPEEAQHLVHEHMSPYLSSATLIIEPSAGEGAFILACEKERPSITIFGYDLDPSQSPICKHPIAKQDFLVLSAADLSSTYSGYKHEDTVLLGNPPFGNQGMLACSFVIHALELGHTVAFILPPSFLKESYQDKIPNGVLKEWYPVSDDNYTVPGIGERKVPSVFCIFEYCDAKPEKVRTDVLLSQLPFVFVKKSDNPDFAIRRVGGTSGKALEDVTLSEQSNYFCKITDANITKKELIEKISSLSIPERDYTVGPRSISKRELTNAYLAAYPFSGLQNVNN